jgi:hypothetical protein
MRDDGCCGGARTASAEASTMLPVFNDDESHEGDIVDLTELHAEISRWFDEHPERLYHLVLPNEGYCEDTYFDVGGRGYEGYREMSESYGFVAFILYIRTAPHQNRPACIFKTHLFIHSSLSMSDDDVCLAHFARSSSDQYLYFPHPSCIDRDLFWTRRDKDPNRLREFFCSQFR